MNGFKQATLTVIISGIAVNSYAGTLSIYGQGHLSADNVDNGKSSSVFVTSSSSRLGFNGEHQLQHHLKVIYQFETGVDLTAQGTNDGNGPNSSGQIFTKGRPSYLGLTGEFGTVLMGHMPYLDQWANDYNLFADQIGDLGNFWEASGTPGRADNVIYYKSINYSGFDFAATYLPEEDNQDTQSFLLKGNYAVDGIKAGIAYSTIGQGEINENHHTALALTFGYKNDNYSFGGGYQQESDISGIDDNDRQSYSIAGSFKVSNKGTIKAQYAITSADALRSDSTMFAIGYDYSLDSQTTLYVAYASTDNDSNVQFSVNGKGHGDKVTPELGLDPSAISIGIVYSFNHLLIK